MAADAPKLVVRPVTPGRWKDFEALFESRGCPGYCWCTPYRFAESHRMEKAWRKEAMRDWIRKGGPVGLLGYVGASPLRGARSLRANPTRSLRPRRACRRWATSPRGPFFVFL